MEYTDLNALGMEFFFNPNSIAIIGASSDFNKPSGKPLHALLSRGYAGRIYPVNPRYKEIAGVPCYPSIVDVPEDVDMAIIGIPAEMVLDMLEQCARKKVKAAVIFSSGFAEVGNEGVALQQKMTEIARVNNIRLLGPNCFGLINLKNSVMASFANIVQLEPVSPMSLGFVTQSGAFGVIIYTDAMNEGVGFSSFVSVGNEADLEFSDFLSYLLDDEETKVIGGYLEGAKDGIKLRNAAEKALGLQKPILIMKVGRSSAGSRAASSHTGSLAGNDKLYDAFFRQMGIIRIDHLNELTSFVIIHRSGHRPAGRNVAILSGSGGAGVMLTDKCESLGLSIPEIKGETRTKLEQYLPSFGSARNPVDLTAQVGTDPELLGKCLRAIVADQDIDSIMINIGGITDKTWPTIVKDIIKVYQSTSKPLVLVLQRSLIEAAPVSYEMLKEEGVPVLMDGVQASQALAHLAWYQEKVKRFTESYCEKSTGDPVNEGTAKLIQNSQQLIEYQCKQVLSQYGIAITREKLATSPEMAVELARQIGYPVVLKVQSPHILHKTESGGIKLNLCSDEEVRHSFKEIVSNSLNYMPGADIHGVLVQEMLKGGIEVIIGTTEDPVFGQVVMFGLGGIFVEALQDVSFRITPIERRDAEDMVKEIKGYRVLQGLRGKPPVDFNILIDTILKVSRLVTDHSTSIKELDINPMVVFEEGARVVDALIIKKQ